jgi:hypothetical protein
MENETNLSLREESDDEKNIEKVISYVFKFKKTSPFEEKKEENDINTQKGRRRKNFNSNIPGHFSSERDNQLRSIKVVFHKYMINYLNKKLKKCNITRKFYRFVGIFQEAINIKINKKLLKTPISELLIKIDAYKGLGNKNLLLYNDLKNNNYLKKYFDMTYKELYEKFIKSNDAKLLIKKKGNKIIKTIVTFISNYQNKDSRNEILINEMRDFYIQLFGKNEFE